MSDWTKSDLISMSNFGHLKSHWLAKQVGAIEKLKTAQRASLAKLVELFASLQYRVFRGEL